MFKHRRSLLCFPLALLSTAAVAQESAPKDVPPSHWAYTAVQDLAGKGLIKGYPPDNRFLGGRTLTRYEMATIIERVLARMDDLLSQKANKGDSDNKADKADIARLESSIGEIRDLVAEFRKELLVIGADLNAAKDEIASLKTQVGQASAKADEAATLADQALESINELKTNTNAALAKKVDVGVGKLRVSGLLQTWAATPFGRTLNGNYVTTAGHQVPSSSSSATSPSGRSYGGGVGDTFRLRRGEIALIGNITPTVDYRVMFDVAKIAGVSTTSGTFTTSSGSASAITSVSANPSSNVLQDLWVGYAFAPRWRLEVGQQKTGLSEEGTRSSSQLLTIERSIMNGLPAQIGRVGDIRDTGAMLKFNNHLGSVTLGLFDDNGNDQNRVASTRFKFAMFNAYFTGIRNLTLGAWGGQFIGDTDPKLIRDRLGATVIYKTGPHFFEAEGAFTRDYTTTTAAVRTGSSGRGGYGLYGYSLNKQWQLVGRFDQWDPAYQSTGAGIGGTTVATGRTKHLMREYTAGVNYYILNHNAKIQLNYIWEDPETNAKAFFGVRRKILLGNFQVAF